MEYWLPLRQYPGYSVSSLGRVRNDRRDSLMGITTRKNKHTFVSIVQDGRQVMRSLGTIVAEEFIISPDPFIFNTPIYLDGDLRNCRADNLMWRPRWFALKYTRQFRVPQGSIAPIVDIETGEVFQDLWPLIMTRGLLHSDIVMSVVNRTAVFPTRQRFDWLNRKYC